MFRRAILVLCLCPTLAVAQVKQEPLVEQVRAAIDRGVSFLRRTEGGKGNWESSQLAVAKPGGASALAMLAMANAGLKADDPMMQRGLKYIREMAPKFTYVISLQTMVLAEVGDARDKELIQKNVDWLIRNRVIDNGQMMGWGYTDDKGIPDNSNSQYAVLGLYAGRQAGAKIDREVWESIRSFYRNTQSAGPRDDGGWPYHPERGSRNSTLTMTIAGLCGLQVAAQELNQSRQGLKADGSAEFCGVYDEDDAIRRSLRWLEQPDSRGGGRRFRFDDQYRNYNCYGIERAGRLTGRRFLAGYDWYREGCEFLVARQQPEGSWLGSPAQIFTPVVETSFALLFLTKGRMPVLLSKWAHGPGEGWNNKHYDAKHLVEFASRELFKQQPLAWQAYDARELAFRSREERTQEVGTLLQSPVLYMNGHALLQMTDTQEQILKQYLEEGGFLMAESCCGRTEFTNSFRQLMKKIFPENPLRPLPPEHPIWKTYKAVPPDFVKLEGIELGCKTVVVFSPQPLAGYWEDNLFKEGRGRDAFNLAANAIAYATGLEAPKDRLTPGNLTDDKADRAVPRGVFQVAQLRHEGDWQPAPRAMRNLMRHLAEKQKLDVSLRTEEMIFAAPDLFKYKFLYLHGRGRFTATTEGIENVRSNLQTGGTLLADACCGSPGFDASFREFAAKLLPAGKLEPIPVDDPLYSAELNGRKLDQVKVRLGGIGAGYDTQAPALEGIKIDGRWAVIYSKYDLGCALEKHSSGDCKGHDHESALKLGTAAVLYSLKK